MNNSILGFYGEHRWLSNFEPVIVDLEGMLFPSVEHAYVAAKTTKRQQREAIAKLATAAEAKRFGRLLVLREDWDSEKIMVMTDLLVQKFSQEPFQAKLLATGDAYIEETNTWNDKFWGVCRGVGENNLGKIIMEIRKLLREIHGSTEEVSPFKF